MAGVGAGARACGTPAPSASQAGHMLNCHEPRAGINVLLSASGRSRSQLGLAYSRLMLVTTARLRIEATAVPNAVASFNAPAAQAAGTLTFNINASLRLVGLAG